MTIQLSYLGVPSNGISVSIPPHLASMQMKWASEVECTQYIYGLILRQTYRSRRFSVTHFTYEVTDRVQGLASNDKETILLHYTLKSDVTCQVEKDATSILLAENTYCAFSFRQGSIAFTISPGRTETLYFQCDPVFLTFIAERFTALQAITESQENDEKVAKAIPSQEISEAIKNILQKELFSMDSADTVDGGMIMVLSRLFHQYQSAMEVDNPAELTKVAKQALIQAIKEEITSGPDKQKHSYTYFARKYAISERTLKRIFRQHSDISLSAFLHDQLMLKALDMRKQQHTFENIAHQLGYSDKSSLYHAMNKYTQYKNN